jgi:hypothetical protein
VFGPQDPETGEIFHSAVRGWRLHIAGNLKAISLVYVKDLVEGVVRAATADIAKGKTYFFCYDEPVSLEGFFDLIENAFDEIEFLQPGGSTSSRAAATAVELQFAL